MAVIAAPISQKALAGEYEVAVLSRTFVSSVDIQDLQLWEKTRAKRTLYDFTLEITARCNNDCRHCYINLPAGDRQAKARELTVEMIGGIADEAVELGALWCLISGGEPLLRPDFPEIYMLLKRKGLLLSVFTNATLVKEQHVALFKQYPPRDIEVTVYGVTEETYERVTRRPGSFAAFMRGLNLLFESGVKVRLKSMALRSNLHEQAEIRRFCGELTKDYSRFDAKLHLRYDGDPVRNEEIKAERLTAAEIVALERADTKRFQAMQKDRDTLINLERRAVSGNYLFLCGAGRSNFNVGPDGIFRLCPSLCAPGTTYDLRQGTLRDAWENHVPRVRQMQSSGQSFLDNCRFCPLINLCLWCPAHAHLETGELDVPVEYFCEIAHARAEALREASEQDDCA